MFFEDTTAAMEEIEQLLQRPMPLSENLGRLKDVLLRSVLTGTNPHAQTRCVLWYASLHPAGRYVRDNLRSRVLDNLEFRSRRKLFDCDLLMQPYYGHVIPALDELVALGMPAATRDYIVAVFRRDNAAERVLCVALMVFWGAQYILGARDPMFGQSTPRARQMKTPTTVPRSSVDHRAGVVLRGTATATADGVVT